MEKLIEEVEDVWTNGRRSAKWRIARCKGSARKNGLKPKPSEQGGGRAEKDKTDGKADLKIKAKTKTWSNVAKGRKKEDLERANSDKSGNETKIVDLVEKGDSEEAKAKWTRRQSKSTSVWKSQRVKGHQGPNIEGANKGLKSRCTDCKGQGAQNHMRRGTPNWRVHGTHERIRRGVQVGCRDTRRSWNYVPTGDDTTRPQVELEGES